MNWNRLLLRISVRSLWSSVLIFIHRQPISAGSGRKRILHRLAAVQQTFASHDSHRTKIGEFQPEYKGKMEFYLNILNDTVKLPHENPAIGIIICKSKSRMIVEYALKSSNMPIGVATYSLSSELPEAYKNYYRHRKK